MDLLQDWKSFQRVFVLRKKKSAMQGPEGVGPVHFIVNRGIVIAGYADREDLSEWIGTRTEDVLAHFLHRSIYLHEQKTVDEQICKARELPHFLAQGQMIQRDARATQIFGDGKRRRTQPSAVILGPSGLPVAKHFLLEALEGWWAKVLPSAYGIYIQIQTDAGAVIQGVLVVVRRGQVESFGTPDLNGHAKERSRDGALVVKYLSEKYSVPVQGIFVRESEWVDWSGDPDPWRKVARALRAGSMKLAPFNWSLTTLIANRAFLGL